MSSSAMSAAGIRPEELNPYWPNDVIIMNVRLCFTGYASELTAVESDRVESSRITEVVSAA